MGKFFYVLCIISLGLFLHTKAQTFTDSNLPIVIINIDGNAGIPDQPRVKGNMKIINRGTGVRNFVSDQNDNAALNYNGRLEIEVRGSSSQSLPKKQYGFTTLLADNVSNNNVSLLGMPKENDWVLNGLAFDASLIRDYICYNLSRKIGMYAPRTAYCEVIINGDYKGLYILQEKIKVDDNRVDITKMDENENTSPEISGGYITKADKVTDGDPIAWVMPSYISKNADFIHETPKPSKITSQQHNYIKSIFEKLAATAASNTSLSDGYPSVIDIPTFIDFMILNELSANVDAYQYSTFFHKDRNGKLRAGPLWDLNLTFGNDLTFWGLDRSKTNTWQFDNGDNNGARFWKDLFNNASFKCYLSKRWNELTSAGAPLSITNLNTFIDETSTTINEAMIREQDRWGTVGDYVQRINGIKNFLVARQGWITSNIGSFSACNNVVTPPLVITKIMYHPDTSDEFNDSGNQEFIEIVNNGDETINLTGFYFLGTGFVYQFPVGSTLEPHGIIHIANDHETFIRKYGFNPFGEFTRNLSNTGHRLALADAFGNIVDEVMYSKEAPWPNVYNNGFYLKLKDNALDNSLAASWIASKDVISSNVVTVGLEEETLHLQLYPNPTESSFRINTNEVIKTFQLSDLQGSVLASETPERNEFTFEMTDYPKGMYMVLLKTNRQTIVRKVLKK